MNEFEISALVAKGYLPEEARSDRKAIKAAIEALVSDLALESGSRSWNLRKNWKLAVTRHTRCIVRAGQGEPALSWHGGAVLWPLWVGSNFAMHWNGHTREQVTLDGEMTWNMP
jgi:hypothetical protein